MQTGDILQLHLSQQGFESLNILSTVAVVDLNKVQKLDKKPPRLLIVSQMQHK